MNYPNIDGQIESRLNMHGIQEEAARRHISVNQYFHEYAEHLSEVYMQWLQQQGERREP